MLWNISTRTSIIVEILFSFYKVSKYIWCRIKYGKRVDEPIFFSPAKKVFFPNLCFLFKNMCELKILAKCALSLRIAFLCLSQQYCGYALCTMDHQHAPHGQDWLHVWSSGSFCMWKRSEVTLRSIEFYANTQNICVVAFIFFMDLSCSCIFSEMLSGGNLVAK